jgi:hypothetical protein
MAEEEIEPIDYNKLLSAVTDTHKDIFGEVRSAENPALNPVSKTRGGFFESPDYTVPVFISRIDALNEVIEEGDNTGYEKLSEKQKEEYNLAQLALGKISESLTDEQARNIESEELKIALQDSKIASKSEGNFKRRSIKSGEDIKDEEDGGFNTVQGAYQCFLLYNLYTFAQAHRNALKKEPSENDRAQLGYAGVDPNTGWLRTRGYYAAAQHERIILADEGSSGSEMMTRLSAQQGAERFLEIRTHEYAQLVPYLRIYKIFRNHENSNETKMVEIEFKNGINLDGIAKELTIIKHPGNLEVPLVSRGSAIGVKSFDWTFLGTDPYTATRDIRANLKIHLQDFSTLIREHIGTNLLKVPGEVGPELPLKYKYVDLLINPDCRRTDKKNVYGQLFSPECYEIRIDIGYYPPNHNSDGAEGLFSKKLNDAVKSLNQSLYLVPIKHSFDINDNGTIELSIDMIGRLEAILGDKKFNVLFPYGGFASVGIDAADKRLSELREINNPSTAIKEEIKELELFKSNLIIQLKQSLFSGIISRMESSSLVHTCVISNSDFATFLQWQGKPISSEFLPKQINFNDVEAGISKGAGEIFFGFAGTTQEELKTSMEKFDEELASNTLLATKKVINYVFLGDLIAAVTDNVLGEAVYLRTSAGYLLSDTWLDRVKKTFNKLAFSEDITEFEELGDSAASELISEPKKIETLENIKKNLRIILGNIDVKFKGPGTPNEPVSINLAHIPISLDSFYKFMKDRVLSNDSNYYSYFEFLGDLLSELVTDLLGNACFEGLVETRARARTLTKVATKEINKNGFKFEDRTGFRTLDIKVYNSENPAFHPEEHNFNITVEPHTYFILGAEDNVPQNLHGDLISDSNIGISHIFFGADRGILKNARLEKTNQEFLPEARYANEGDFFFNQLASVYDANFHMIGNTLFVPGQYIYYNTIALGAGDPLYYKKYNNNDVTRSWANIMGLGGYHLVTEVQSSISPGRYTTNVKARWVTAGSLPEDEE